MTTWQAEDPNASADSIAAFATLATALNLGAISHLNVGAGLTSSSGNLVANLQSVAGLTGAPTASAVKTALAIATGDVSGLGTLATLNVGAGLTSSSGNLVANLQSVAGRTGNVVLSNSDVSGLGSLATLNVGAGLTSSAGNLVANLQSVAGLTGAPTATAVKSALAIASGDVSGLGSLATLSVINASTTTVSNLVTSNFATNVVDTDATMAANSATRIPAQSAVVSYLQNALAGLTWKKAVACATTGNIVLAGEQTIDGVTTSLSDVLVHNQTIPSQNGIYTSGTTWTRRTDLSVGTEFPGATVYVEGGSTQAGSQWNCTNTGTVTVDTTAITFVQIAGAGTYSAGSGLSLSGNQFSVGPGAITATMLSSVTGTGAAALAASPTFTGAPSGPTAALNTNTTQFATTAFVLGQAATAAPLMDGTAAVGTSTTFARADHVHATDTSRLGVMAASSTYLSLAAAGALATLNVGAGLTSSAGNLLIGSSAITSAMLASSLTFTTPTISGSAAFSGTSGGVAGSIFANSSNGLAMRSLTGSVNDFSLGNPSGSAYILNVPTGTLTVNFASTPTAPTVATSDNSTNVATTAYVTAKVAALTTGVSQFNGRTGAITPQMGDYSSFFAAKGTNSDITSLSGLTTALSQAQGGTGASSLLTALNAITPANLLPFLTAIINAAPASGASGTLVNNGGVPVVLP